VLRVLALIAVSVGLAALTAAACVLSYSSVHYLAIQANVHGRLASIYPLIFDAMLVIAGCSVLALRGAGLISKLYSWLCMLALLAALAAGGALHAAATKIPHKPAAVAAAIVPWALVLIGFGLLVALLRHARLRRLGKRAKPGAPTESRGADAAPAKIGAPVIAVTEREREEEMAPQRPVIPGLPPRPPAIADSESSLTEPGHEGRSAFEASDGDTGTEPPTVPNAATTAPGERMKPAVSKFAQASAGVRRAEMQLRARGPRQATQGTAEPDPAAPAGASTAAQGWPTPFMPNVGQPGSTAEQVEAAHRRDAAHQEDAAPADPGERAAEADRKDAVQRKDGAQTANETSSAGDESPAEQAEAHAEALPKRVPGQQPVISGLDSRAATSGTGEEPPTEPNATALAGDDPADTSRSTGEPAGSEEGEDAGGLPAFRRTRSTPTPPQGD
jgi:hypothetical protein